MQVPKFETTEDIQDFLNIDDDAWYRQMVVEYIEMCTDINSTKDNIGVRVADLDVHELNGWLQDEMKSLSEGYEDYYDN